MSDPVRALRSKADRAIHAAEILHKDREADFAVDVSLTDEDAARVIQQAREFLQAARAHLSAE